MKYQKVVSSVVLSLLATATVRAQVDGVDRSTPVWTVNQTIVVGPGDHILQPRIPPCPDQRDTRIPETVNTVTRILAMNWGWSAVLAQQGGAFMGWFTEQLQKEVAKGTGGTIAQLASDMGVSPRYAACGTAVLVAPQGYHFSGNAIATAYDQGVNPIAIAPKALCDDGSDPPYVKCRQPYAAWRVVQYDKIVVAVFVNWSSNTRVASLSAPIAPDVQSQSHSAQPIDARSCTHLEKGINSVQVWNDCPIPIRVTSFQLQDQAGALSVSQCVSAACTVMPGLYSAWPEFPGVVTIGATMTW